MLSPLLIPLLVTTFVLASAETLISDEFLLRALLSSTPSTMKARQLAGVTAPGAVAATSCGTGTCTTTGGGNYISRSMSLNTATGIYSGSLTTNACPNHAGAYQYGGITDAKVSAAFATCQTWTLPIAAYSTFPIAAPLRGVIGYTISGGEVIYGPM